MSELLSKQFTEIMLQQIWQYKQVAEPKTITLQNAPCNLHNLYASNVIQASQQKLIIKKMSNF